MKNALEIENITKEKEHKIVMDVQNITKSLPLGRERIEILTGTSFLQQLTSILDVMIAVASLSLIAAVIIIANAVALAMLERKRELGILKAVGYTASTILSEVLIENGIIGGVGAFSGMLLAAGGVALLGKILFNLTVSMQPIIIVTMVASAALLAMLTAALVAWHSVRVRPLAVLKYE